MTISQNYREDEFIGLLAKCLNSGADPVELFTELVAISSGVTPNLVSLEVN